MSRLERARIAGKVNRDAIEHGFSLAKPGVTLRELDTELGSFIKFHEGCTPAFLGYKGFPRNACISVNYVAVHGVADEHVIKEGDLLTIDIGTIYEGMYADAASTRVIGSELEHEQEWHLSESVQIVLQKQLEVVRDGTSLLDIAQAGQAAAEDLCLHMVEDLGGHYIGEQLHMDPFIPNCIDYRRGKLSADLQKKKYSQHLLRTGDIICIEPVITYGSTDLTVGADDWTCSTAALSAHAEHMILVTETGYEILS